MVNIIEIRQPLKEDYGIEMTNVYIKHRGDHSMLRDWCTETFGEYRLAYSREELDEPKHATVFIFNDMEEAMAFKLRWI